MVLVIEYVEIDGKYWIVGKKWQKNGKTFIKVKSIAYLPCGVRFQASL